MSVSKYFATCGRGIEPVLADELRALGASDVKPGRGGVAFAGDRGVMYKANLYARTAVRVLMPVLEIEVHSPDELYEAVRGIHWARYMTPDHTLAVDCNVRDSRITHSLYASRRVKDAICDQFRDDVGRRPSVDAENPMVAFNLHVHRDIATLSLDTSGTSLHKRGYRPIQTKAPLNEALAAAIVLTTGWKGDRALVDPMCGSGTLPIEATWIALNRPPGLTRKRFGFMGWPDHDQDWFNDVRDEARRGVGKALPVPVYGSDLRGDVVSLAIDNAKAAGVGHLLKIFKRDLRQLELPDGPPGTILVNPPYGERIGDERELVWLYKLMGEMFKAKASGWTAWVFTGNERLADEIDMEPSASVPLFNGKIPCRLLRYEVR